MRALLCMMILCASTMMLQAQDKSYNTDELKKLKRISADEWKRLKEDAGGRAQRHVSANSADLSMQVTKGRLVVKSTQTLDLKNETEVVLDHFVSGGQDAKGNPSPRNRFSFKLGPGKYDVKDGLIRRVE